MNSYPTNVCVHGNGFIQISLGGLRETRIHIWDDELMELTQKVNTQWHDHRFGFSSTVLRGALRQQEIDFFPVFSAERDSWSRWQATGERQANGNRPLVKQPRHYRRSIRNQFVVAQGSSYSMPSREIHRSIPLVSPTVTLFTKTQVLPEDDWMASVYCPRGHQPDQEYDRFQIPFDKLLRHHIWPALRGTPLESVTKEDIFRYAPVEKAA